MINGMAQYGGVSMMQPQHPLINVYRQLCQQEVNPMLIQQYGLNNQELNNILSYEETAANQLLTEFCAAYVNVQTGNTYDPNLLKTIIYKVVAQYIATQLRNPNRAALPGVTPFATPSVTGNSMDYYAIGKPEVNPSMLPQVTQNQNTRYIQDTMPVHQPTQNHVAIPSKTQTAAQEVPMPPVVVQEEAEGDITCNVDKLVESPQTESEKKLMDIINSSKAQTCKAMFHFSSEKDGECYAFNHVHVHVPYTDAKNAFMDMATAYPQLFEGKYATLMEFYTYLPMGIHFTQGKPIYDRLKDMLTKNPLAIDSYVIEQGFGDAHKTKVELITGDMVRMLNNMFGCYLSKVNTNDSIEICNITNLSDIADIKSGTDPALSNFTKFEKYQEHVLGCVKAVVDSYFHINNPDRTPYLLCENEEMNLAASMEMSGIRIGDYTGRDINLLTEEDEHVIKSIVDQLRKRTIGLKKHTVLFTNIDCPDIRRMAKYGNTVIRKTTHPFHYIMRYILEKYPINMYTIDLSGGSEHIPVQLNMGVSVNKYMVLKFANYNGS